PRQLRGFEKQTCVADPPLDGGNAPLAAGAPQKPPARAPAGARGYPGAGGARFSHRRPFLGHAGGRGQIRRKNSTISERIWGKLYRTTLDANVIALDLKTGKEVWRTKSADPKDGYSMTGAPLVANGVVIAGVAGAEFGH